MDRIELHLLLAVFATWRLSTLLARDDGPWDAIARLRATLGDGPWGRLLDCFHCVSLWVAAPLAWALGRDALEQWLAWHIGSIARRSNVVSVPMIWATLGAPQRVPGSPTRDVPR